MREAEISCRVALGRIYGDLTNPDYCKDPDKAEARLKDAVRQIYPEHKGGFPAWVQAFIKKWEADKRSAGEGLDRGAVSGVSERGD